MINVLQFGVVGRGNEETQSIQSIIDNAPTGSTIYFPAPPVKYVINKALNITKGIKLEAESSDVMIEKSGPGTLININLSVTSKVYINDLTLSGGTDAISIAAASQPLDKSSKFSNLRFLAQNEVNGSAIKLNRDVDGLSVENIYFSGGAYCVWAQVPAEGLRETSFDNFKIEGAGVAGFYLSQSTAAFSSLNISRPSIKGCPVAFSCSNVQINILSPDLRNNTENFQTTGDGKVTVIGGYANVTGSSAVTIISPTNNTAIATPTLNGFMSSSDKARLDSLSQIPLGETLYVVASSETGSVYANGVNYSSLLLSANSTMDFQFSMGYSGSAALNVVYAMDASNAGNLNLKLSYVILSGGAAPTTALIAQSAFVITPGADTTCHTISSSQNPTLVLSGNRGDLIFGRFTRVSGTLDTHTGNMRILQMIMSGS